MRGSSILREFQKLIIWSYHPIELCHQRDIILHTSCNEGFSENDNYKAVTYLIFFGGKFWFQKYDFWKNSLRPPSEVAKVKGGCMVKK